jgi:predicted metal-dependent enzyme (double-stranded beta helix superfamily)|tara:strand:- start:625 stop:1161 length:537 start_codon:yes stop_codon:yes gene_type:complete
MGFPMGYTLKKFADDCHDILVEDCGIAGREKVRVLLCKVLVDPNFVSETFPDSNDLPRTVLYEDETLGFAICSHVYKREAMSKPHDHGAHWAIYGQVAGQTEMFDYEFVDLPENEDEPGTCRATRNYRLMPGDAHLYNVGDLHAPRREGATKLIRIEGVNLDTIKRVYHKEISSVAAE